MSVREKGVCPRCGRELTELVAITHRRIKCMFNGLFVGDEDVEDERVEFYCPSCNIKLTEDDIEAVGILLGMKMVSINSLKDMDGWVNVVESSPWDRVGIRDNTVNIKSKHNGYRFDFNNVWPIVEVDLRAFRIAIVNGEVYSVDNTIRVGVKCDHQSNNVIFKVALKE
jgi:hypothetical protein